jgi:hypothetical protein
MPPQLPPHRLLPRTSLTITSSKTAPIAASTIAETHARTEIDPELRKYPARNEGPGYSHDEIADEAQARALDDLARKPAGRDADGQYHEKALA